MVHKKYFFEVKPFVVINIEVLSVFLITAAPMLYDQIDLYTD